MDIFEQETGRAMMAETAEEREQWLNRIAARQYAVRKIFCDACGSILDVDRMLGFEVTFQGQPGHYFCCGEACPGHDKIKAAIAHVEATTGGPCTIVRRLAMPGDAPGEN